MSEHPSPTTPSGRGRSPRWIAFGFLVGLGLLVVVILAADGKELLQMVGEMPPWKLLLPLLCTMGSYSAMARSYQQIAALAGLRLGFRETCALSLVSTAANYVFSTGGLSGLAMRSYYFSQRHGARWGTAVSISLAQTVVTNLVLCAFLFWGLLTLFFHREVERASVIAAGAFFLVSFALFLLIVAVVGSRRTREVVFGGLLAIADRLAAPFGRRGRALRDRLEDFESELHEGVDFLIARGRRMWGPVFYIWLDWFLMMATLYAAFVCVGVSVPMGVVVIGFSIGVFLSIVNLVPGGLGIMEGSMAAVFAGLGVPLEAAVVATLLYRVFYYLFPLLLSLLFLRRMMFPSVPEELRPEAVPRRSPDPRRIES
jgi:glycosyltransferase 2 family protein